MKIIDDNYIDKCVASPSGCAIIAVHGDEATPSFAYTVGLIQHGFPEIITLGSNQLNGYFLISEVVTLLQKTEKVLNHGDIIDIGQMADGTSGRGSIGSVGQWAIDQFMFASVRYANRKSILLTARQLIMPDCENRSPFDVGYDEAYMQDIQFPLNEARSWRLN